MVVAPLRPSYRRNGFVASPCYGADEFARLRDFAINWLYSLLRPWTGPDPSSYPLGEYHRWGERLGVDHDSVFRQKNRYRVPPQDILSIILNARVRVMLSEIGCPHFDVWDEGIGSLGFRMVRPNRGDGYPMTRKQWGDAPKVISLWIPIVGTSSDQTICLVPGSHLREYDRYMPSDGKYVREYRLANAPADLQMVRPEVALGDVVVFHPNTLHTEEVTDGDVTRLNLELRVLPRAVT